MSQVQSYVDANFMDWLKDTVENDCKMMALANGLPNHLVDAIVTVRTGYLRAEVRNTYEKDGVPIGKFVNGGTVAHFILGNPLLHWTDGLGFNYFATYVNHPGFEGYHYMERGKQTGMPRFKQKIHDEIKSVKQFEGLSNELR